MGARRGRRRGADRMGLRLPAGRPDWPRVTGQAVGESGAGSERPPLTYFSPLLSRSTFLRMSSSWRLSSSRSPDELDEDVAGFSVSAPPSSRRAKGVNMENAR